MEYLKAAELNRKAKKLFESLHGAAHDGVPNVKGWAITYIEAEKPIPRVWYNDFLDELTSDNDEYRHALEASIRYFGVRWS
jgi:hypothetical protein